MTDTDNLTNAEANALSYDTRYLLGELRATRSDIAELRESFARLETRLAAIEHHMAGLGTSFGGQQSGQF